MRTAVVGALACVALGAPAAALANDFQQVYDQYKKQGTIKPCSFSENQLRNAEKETPPDVEQYAPSFLDALASAREQAGNCHRRAVPAPAPATTPAPPAATPAATTTTTTPAATATQPVATQTTPAPTPPAHATSAPALDPRPAAHDTSAPAAIWLLAALAAIVALAALASVLAWWFGWSIDPWSRPLGASFDDFGSRFGDTSREFGDWLRLGH